MDIYPDLRFSACAIPNPGLLVLSEGTHHVESEFTAPMAFPGALGYY